MAKPTFQPSAKSIRLGPDPRGHTSYNPVSPSHIMVSLTMDALIKQGYVAPLNPIPSTLRGMGSVVTSTYQITLSPEPKNYSLIAKQTSNLPIGNSVIVNPQIKFSKPGQKTAEELGMTFATDSPLFVQDARMTPSQIRQYMKYAPSKTNPAPLSHIANFLCSRELSAYGPESIYMKNKNMHTRANIADTGGTKSPPKLIRRTGGNRPARERELYNKGLHKGSITSENSKNKSQRTQQRRSSGNNSSGGY